jgi:elongation of very long chain fatty acids protein 7
MTEAAKLTQSWDFIYRAPVREWEKVVYNWPLISSPVPTVLFCAVYLYVVKFLGPSLMRDRKPFQIKSLIFVYNVLTVLFNLYIFTTFARLGWFTGYSLSCQDFDDSPKGHAMNWNAYLFFVSKFFDFADTIFFVLTKKNSHISYLHLIHHTTMPIYCYIGMRLGPNGHGTFAPLLNSFVHVIMYSYYALALLGPAVRPYLWWKKYLTQMQLIQFFAIFIHSTPLYTGFPKSCKYPVNAFYIYALLTTIFSVLFLNFYIQSYLKPCDNRKKAGIESAAKEHVHVPKHDVNQNIVLNGRSSSKKIH